MNRHLIGLLLGTEEDWPAAFETIVRRMGAIRTGGGDEHAFDVERITIEPFDLRAKPRYDLVIDRLAYWYYVPREWLKKIALMDDVYLLNSPFTFQSMEKHAAYCAMMRLGLKVPDTVLVPYKNPPDHAKWAYTASQYNQPFDLDAIAERMGYPLFMKPYDGGAWVRRLPDQGPRPAARRLRRLGERLMHLQKAVDGYDVFARSLSIGAGDDGDAVPARAADARPVRGRPRVPLARGRRGGRDDRPAGECVLPVGVQLVRDLVEGGDVHPIDYANACPDVALTRLHYYFPWAMKALVRWTVFVLITGRSPRLDLDRPSYFEIADREDLTYGEKLGRLPPAGRRRTSRSTATRVLRGPAAAPGRGRPGLGVSPDFDTLLRRHGADDVPGAEHDRFVAHFRGLVGLWVTDAKGSLGRRAVSEPISTCCSLRTAGAGQPARLKWAHVA